MPYRTEKKHLKLPQDIDGRRKILPSQYEEVKIKYQSLKSLRAVAGYYGVDKRTIQFILYPERLLKLKEHYKKIKHWQIYYNQEKHTKSARKTRQKRAIFFKNPLAI